MNPARYNPETKAKAILKLCVARELLNLATGMVYTLTGTESAEGEVMTKTSGRAEEAIEDLIAELDALHPAGDS